MITEYILFYVFSLLSILFSIIVIISKNPIHSVLSLVLVFFNAAGLMLLLGVEFLALLFLIVYVGAVAVLFLFVIMMLNIKVSNYQTSTYRYFPLILLITVLIGLRVTLISDNTLVLNAEDYNKNIFYEDLCLNPVNMWDICVITYTNTMLLGNVIYTHFAYLFLVSGIILLVSMLGAISLTLHRRNDIKRQQIYKQLQRNFNNTIIWKG